MFLLCKLASSIFCKLRVIFKLNGGSQRYVCSPSGMPVLASSGAVLCPAGQGCLLLCFLTLPWCLFVIVAEFVLETRRLYQVSGLDWKLQFLERFVIWTEKSIWGIWFCLVTPQSALTLEEPKLRWLYLPEAVRTKFHNEMWTEVVFILYSIQVVFIASQGARQWFKNLTYGIYLSNSEQNLQSQMFLNVLIVYTALVCIVGPKW